jgi:hypothetical protein
MSTKCIREIFSTTTSDSTGLAFYLKCVAMFMRFCLGYTNPTEHIQSRGQIGGGAGISAGDVKTMGGPGIFDQSDIGKSVTLTNCFDPNNNGTYAITNYFNRWQIEITKAGSGGAETYGGFDWTVNDSNSYWSFLKSGTNGEFNLTGSDEDFRDSVAGVFAASDVGKWLVIAGNNRNAGVYKITGYTSSSTVTVDFRSAATEYPTAQTGLSWWMIDETGSTPIGEGDYFRLKTPHAHGWEVEIAYYAVIEVPAYTAHPRTSMRVARNGIWGDNDSSKVWWGVNNSRNGYYYGMFDTAGEMLAYMVHQITTNLYNGSMVCNITPYETGHSTEELVAVMGSVISTWSHSDSGTFNHNIGGGTTNYGYAGHGYIWRGWSNAERDVLMMEATYAGSANGLEKWTSREKNRRLSGSGSGTGDSFSLSGTTVTLTDAGASFVASDVGKTIKISGATTPGNDGEFVITSYISGTQLTYENASGATEAFAGTWSISDFWDVLNGITIIGDWNNSLGEYELIGRLKCVYGVGQSVGVRTPFNDIIPHGLDMIHIVDGFAFEWPGVTPQH